MKTTVFYSTRSCTEEVQDDSNPLPCLLSKYRDTHSYVLLGESGSGKSSCFKHEASQSGCMYITARSFIDFDIEESWNENILFIDGLDEVRAGSDSGQLPLSLIRKKLRKLDSPKYRISCREADWLGDTDRQSFQEINPSRNIKVLHLEPLDEVAIREIAQHEDSGIKINEFIEWSKKQGFIPLISNPAILKIFVNAVSGGNWPENREEAYRMACHKIVKEYSKEHQQADKKDNFSINDIILMAGKLSAHQLISGVEGFSLFPDENKQYPYYGSVFKDDTKLIEYTLKTKLFKQGVGDNTRDPLHRSVSGYLAAKYLTHCIDNKALPVDRVISIISSVDGGVISSLREFYAWFVTICIRHREYLLTRDPHGIIIYGDVSSFPVEHKIILLERLYEEAQKYTWFRNGNWSVHPYGALSTADMEQEFKRILNSKNRSDAKQSLVYCVLNAMEYGAKFPELSDTLIKIVSDDTRFRNINELALKLVLKSPSSSKQNQSLKKLLKRINNGMISDENDNLQGILLNYLYPDFLASNNIFLYLHEPKNKSYFGSYYKFWNDHLIQRTNDSEIAVLLDMLVKNSQLQIILSEYNFIYKLLITGLLLNGEKIKIVRLYHWLSLILDKYGSRRVNKSEKNISVEQWLEERPDIYKDLILESINHWSHADEQHFYRVFDRVYFVKEPNDIIEWYLKQALIQKDSIIKEGFFNTAISRIYQCDPRFNFKTEDVFNWIDTNPEFSDLFKKSVVETGDAYSRRIDRAVINKKHKKRIKDKKDAWLSQLVENKNNIINGNASIHIYSNIAIIYNGNSIETKGDSPIEHITSVFPDDSDMVSTLLIGIKTVIYRADFPSVQDILSFNLKHPSNGYVFSQPVFLSLDENYKLEPDIVKTLEEELYKKVFALYLIDSMSKSYEWMDYFLLNYPKQLTSIYIQYVLSKLKANSLVINCTYQIGRNDNWEEIAKCVVIPILTQYPVRQNNKNIDVLDSILKAAIQHHPIDLLNLIDVKLSAKGMSILQKGRWIAAGLVLDPDKYFKITCDFFEDKLSRIYPVTGFLTSRENNEILDYKLSNKILNLIVNKLGIHVFPYHMSGVSTFTSKMQASDLVRSLIKCISSDVTNEANHILKELYVQPGLKKWKNLLQGEIYRQETLIRDSQYDFLTIHQVKHTLENAEPANVSDLMNVVLDHLRQLAKRIRDESTDDYKQYWNTDKNNNPDKPKVENGCRDALESDLKRELASLRVEVSKEASYADDKRADIKAIYNGTQGFNVPVEIKRCMHNDLWTALWEQLIKQYTRDPGAQGYGIYLIFWFGPNDVNKSPDGIKPTSAKHLHDLLWDMMSPDERLKIGLCVIDCSLIK